MKFEILDVVLKLQRPLKNPAHYENDASEPLDFDSQEQTRSRHGRMC